jgi:hypothetical protein
MKTCFPCHNEIKAAALCAIARSDPPSPVND